MHTCYSGWDSADQIVHTMIRKNITCVSIRISGSSISETLFSHNDTLFHVFLEACFLAGSVLHYNSPPRDICLHIGTKEPATDVSIYFAGLIISETATATALSYGTVYESIRG